jgi:hypothetical protein
MKVNEKEMVKVNRNTLWIIWGIFTIFAIYIACHHEPWYDEYHVWVMCKHLKMTWIWSHMTKEGHFVLWHYLIYPFVRIGCSFWCLQFVSVFLISVAVWVFLMKAPFGMVTKILVTFSYPVLYQFSIISRCYALIPILLFLTAWLYTIQNKNLFLYCFFVGLIAHTHAYMEGLVGALFLLFCYEQIYLPWKKKENLKKTLTAALITICVVFFAFLQVKGSLHYASEKLIDNKNNFQELIESLFFFTSHKFWLLGDWHLLFPRKILDSPLCVIAFFVLWGIIIYNLYVILWKYKENRQYFFVYVVAMGWQIWMALSVYGFGHQRIFLPVFVLIFILWLSYRYELKKNIATIIACLFLVTAGHYNIYRDIKEVFSEDTLLFNYVENNVKPGEKLYFTAYFLQCSESDLYYQYDIHFIGNQESYNVSSPKFMTEELLNQAFDECQATNTIYLFSDKKYENVVGAYKLTMLTNVGKYYIFKTDKVYQHQ